MAELKFVYWFAYFSPELPSVRYRAVHPLAELHRQGIDHKIIVPGWSPLTLFRFMRAYLEALVMPRHASVIVVQRLFTRGFYAMALKLLVFVRGSRAIYDIDDAEYMEHRPTTIHYFMRHCALVTVGSAALRQYALRFNPNVRLLTSPIPHHHARRAGKRGEVLRIGWIGCCWGTHRDNLDQLLFPALRQLSIPVHLVLIGTRHRDDEAAIRALFHDRPGLTVEFPTVADWGDEESIHGLLAQVDMGVAPLRDTEINRCKSAFKVKQFLSCGVPVLASPIGENPRFVHDGVNGLLCEDSDAFRRGIERWAIMDDAEYDRLCHAAFASTFAFDLKHYCGEFTDATSGLIRSPIITKRVNIVAPPPVSLARVTTEEVEAH